MCADTIVSKSNSKKQEHIKTFMVMAMSKIKQIEADVAVIEVCESREFCPAEDFKFTQGREEKMDEECRVGRSKRRFC